MWNKVGACSPLFTCVDKTRTDGPVWSSEDGQIRELNGRPVQIQIHFGTHPIRPIECRGVEIPNWKWEFWHMT